MTNDNNLSCMTRHQQGTMISVHVVPRASKSEICGLHGNSLRVRLYAPPVDGKANKALCEFLAKTVGVATRSVSLESGETGREKRLFIQGKSPEDLVGSLFPKG